MSKIAPNVLPPQSLCEIFERMLAVEVFGREHSRIHAGNFQTGVSQDENAVLWPSVSFSIQGFIEDLPFEYPRMNILLLRKAIANLLSNVSEIPWLKQWPGKSM